jgi:hypothetical protein
MQVDAVASARTVKPEAECQQQTLEVAKGDRTLTLLDAIEHLA